MPALPCRLTAFFQELPRTVIKHGRIDHGDRPSFMHPMAVLGYLSSFRLTPARLFRTV
jgi:hypothetical protein